MVIELSGEEIDKIYSIIKKAWDKNLKEQGVSLPNLKTGDNYTKDALVLVYLYKRLGNIVSKTELTSFIQKYYPDVNDVQQARHLAAQKGWCILSGTRNDIEAKNKNLGNGDYMLVSLDRCFNGFTQKRRDYSAMDDAETWDEIKREYDYRCATCGSKEGDPNLHYPSSETKLTMGHMDPTLPLTPDNIIPQCEKCNRPDRNYFIFDKKGRVIGLADPKFIFRSSKSVQLETLKYLLGTYPNEASMLLKEIKGVK